MADGNKTTRISLEPGKGLLDERALRASSIGPYRLAMAGRVSVVLKNDAVVEVYKNIGVADVIVFVGVGLPWNAPVTPLEVVFGRDDVLGQNSGIPARLGGAVNQTFGFMQLLLPGEQLFAKITDPNVTSQSVVVAGAVF